MGHIPWLPVAVLRPTVGIGSQSSYPQISKIGTVSEESRDVPPFNLWMNTRPDFHSGRPMEFTSGNPRRLLDSERQVAHAAWLETGPKTR